MSRKADGALALLTRFGFTGAFIAAGLILVHWLGRRLVEGFGGQPM